MARNRISARTSAPAIDDYYSEIRDEALLTAEEEQSLAGAIAHGDVGARERLIRANLRLVIKIARTFLGRGLPLEDLVGEGNLGLIRAAEGYDPRFGTRFSTYAAYWIRQSIGQALTNTAALIRLPAHVVVLLSKWRRVERRLRRELGHAPEADQVAAVLNLTPAQRTLIDRAVHAQRLVHEGTEESALWTSEATADPRVQAAEALEAAEELADVYRVLRALDERERIVLGLRFGLGGDEPQTLKEVGRRLGITREWVRKIELRALRKLGAEYASAESAFLSAVRDHAATTERGYTSWDDVMEIARQMGFTGDSDPLVPDHSRAGLATMAALPRARVHSR
jgi:RNA polymerase primary sigma factor